MQGTQVWALVQKNPTCLGETKHLYLNYWPNILESVLCNKKPPQWEALPPQLVSSLCSPQLEETCVQQQKRNADKNLKTNKLKKNTFIKRGRKKEM